MLPVKTHTTGKHIGFGKVILFGEHFVVHGATALVAGVSEYTECRLEVTPGVPGMEVVDRRPAVPGYIREKRAEQRKAHELVQRHLRVDTRRDGLRVHLGGPLVPSSGIGASASDVVALSRALSELYGLHLSEAEVNESAFIGEGGYHGTPSGVDNTAATFGGLMSYRRVDGRAEFHPIPFTAPLYLVVVGTGITASTAKVVEDVRRWKEAHAATFDALMREYATVAERAEEALRSGAYERVGQLMYGAHDLCRQIGISCAELDAIVGECRRHGAWGAKLSGTGRGGIAVALARDAATRAQIAAGLRQTCPAAKFIWEYTVAPTPDAKL